MLPKQLPPMLARRVAAQTANRHSNLIARRCLGTAKRGPEMTDIGGQMEAAKRFVTKPGLTYVEFKYQCDAMRFFIVPVLSFVLCMDIFLRPCKSSYFSAWGPMSWPGNLWYLFSKPKNNVFLTSPPEFKGVEPCVAVKELKAKF